MPFDSICPTQFCLPLLKFSLSPSLGFSCSYGPSVIPEPNLPHSYKVSFMSLFLSSSEKGQTAMQIWSTELNRASEKQPTRKTSMLLYHDIVQKTDVIWNWKLFLEIYNLHWCKRKSIFGRSLGGHAAETCFQVFLSMVVKSIQCSNAFVKFGPGYPLYLQIWCMYYHVPDGLH